MGSGAGIILEILGGVLIKQSLHFDFRDSNNQVEYDAFLARMKLVREVGVKVLVAKSASQLIIGQVNDNYQAKDLQLTKYLSKAKAQATTFEGFTLIHVPREQKERAYLLTVIQEALSWPTIEATKVLYTDKRPSWKDPIIGFLKEDQVWETIRKPKN
ncbi:hypothetical protein CR513_39710, partial [Mucuna pruriens]